MQPTVPARLTSQNPPILPTKPANPNPEVGLITPSRKPTNHINQLRDVWSPNLKLSQPTLEIRPPTPKRKRDPEPTKPKIGPKIGPEKCTKNSSKKNPHPQNKHKIFMNIQGQIQLLTHQGLATSSRRKVRRRNLQENSPPPSPPHQSPPPKTRRRRSEDFQAQLRLFQQETNHGQTEQKPQRLTVPLGENEFTSTPATTVTYHPELDTETHPSPTTLIAKTMPSVLPSTKINQIYKEDPPPVPPLSKKS
jgi:hypothetical protein